jgi:hypothetical protein
MRSSAFSALGSTGSAANSSAVDCSAAECNALFVGFTAASRIRRRNLGDLRHVLAHLHGLEARLKARRIRVPVKRLDLLPREPDQRVAVPQRVVHKGQCMVLRQRHEPERDLGEVYRHGVPTGSASGVAIPIARVAGIALIRVNLTSSPWSPR